MDNIKVNFPRILFLFCIHLISRTEGGCNWPTVFQNTVWHDNTHGDITFVTDTMSGWSFTSYSSTINNWECLVNSEFGSTGGILILKATDTFDNFGQTWVSYLCLQMTKITDASYYYYQKHAVQVNAANERIKINAGDTLTTKAQICEDSVSIPTSEFHFIVLSGSESTAKQWCAPSLLAKMDYTHTPAGGGPVSCDDPSTPDNWDVCTDRMVMTFDYSTCSTEMAYSAAGEVWCVANFTSTYEYVLVYNTDASPTYRFACFVVSTDGTTASMVYNNCTDNQTPTTLAKSHDGTEIGALLTMSPIETCPFTGPTTNSPSASASASASTEEGGGGSSNIGIIAGAAAGSLLILVLIVIITIYCIKKKKSGVSHADDEKEPPPDGSVSNGHVETMEVEDVDNPALTITPERNTLTPLPSKPNGSLENGITPRTLPPIENRTAV